MTKKPQKWGPCNSVIIPVSLPTQLPQIRQTKVDGSIILVIIQFIMEDKNKIDEITTEEKTESTTAPVVPEKKKGFFASLSDEGKQLVSEVGILFLAGVMFIVPIALWMVSKGFFGEILMTGRGGFSPFLDRLLVLSVMFFLLYAVSWIKQDIPYRAVKVFGVMALLALISIVAIQLDTTLLPSKPEFTPLMNKWFFTAPLYSLTSISAVLTSRYLYLGWQFYLTLFAFLAGSGVLLWDIKVELAGNWKTALTMWISFEVLYLIVVWIILQFIGWPMFPPLAI